MSEKKEFISTRKGVTYLDLFAGAGGFMCQDIMDCTQHDEVQDKIDQDLKGIKDEKEFESREYLLAS